VIRHLRAWTARAVVATTLVATTALMAAPASMAAPAAIDPVSPAQARAAQWWLPAMGVTKAQQVTRGKGVKVCLIDNGVDADFPDLKGTRFVGGTDLSGKGSPAGLRPIDLSIHGTAMAAFIAGQGRGPGRTEGLLGTAPDAEIISVAASHDPDESPLEDGLKYCVDHGAQVINYSRDAPSQLSSEGVSYAQARDVVIVAGTGNTGSREVLGTLAGSWGVLAVGGVDRDLTIDPSSTAAGARLIDPSGDPHDQLDAGGVAVMGPYAVTATQAEGPCNEHGFYGPNLAWQIAAQYQRTCGTSVATAVVSGIVALVRAAHPELNAANVINRILRTATPPTDGSKTPSPLYGFGIVNAHAAVTTDIPTVEHNPLGSAYTRSRGIWDSRVTPQRPEPPAHSTLPATDWHIDTPAANAHATGPTAGANPGDRNPTILTNALTPALIAIGGFLATGVVIAVVAVILTRRRRRVPRPPFTGP
jgi:membrane-anchored mycosin MYCP